MILGTALLASGVIYAVDRLDRWWRARPVERDEPAPAPAPDKDRHSDGPLMLSGVALTAAGVGRLVWSPLVLLSTPLMVVSIGQFSAVAWRDWRAHGRVGVALVEVVTYSVALVSGYFVSTALMIFVSRVSAKLARLTEDHAQFDLMEALGGQPQWVWVTRGEVEVEVALADLVPGDLLMLGASEVVPVDGRVVQGQARLDERALTGESWPIDKMVGDPVFATTRVVTGRVLVRVEHGSTETLAAHTLEVMAQTTDYRSKVRARAQEFADAGARTTLLLSGVFWPLVGAEPALALLFASFGDSVRHTGPIAALNYLRRAAAQGTLIKDGRALELLASIDVVVFDKTGTLTEASFELGQIHCFAGLDELTVLALAAAAEAQQEHPIARTITEAARLRGLAASTRLADILVEAGAGLRARRSDHDVVLGSLRLMVAEGIRMPAEAKTWLERQASHGASHV